jgi:hypothetical protein
MTLTNKMGLAFSSPRCFFHVPDVRDDYKDFTASSYPRIAENQ